MRWLWCVAIVMALSGVAHADDEPKPEDLKKMYTLTLDQLKAAQDRKSQLATENEKLAAHIADLEKQLAAANTDLARLKLDAAQFADQSFFLRTHYAAWLHFIQLNPPIQLRWDIYLQHSAPVPSLIPFPLMDPEWPLSTRPEKNKTNE